MNIHSVGYRTIAPFKEGQDITLLKLLLRLPGPVFGNASDGRPCDLQKSCNNFWNIFLFFSAFFLSKWVMCAMVPV